MNDLNKVSVIIPVYNVEAYIRDCVESVVNQTYCNLEIILVDDGSTDQSGKICDKLKETDKRIFVIHKANGGLSDARNAGIDAATGKYITFIDSDDFVAVNYVEYLLGLIKEYNADISVCEYKETFSRNIEEYKIEKDEKRIFDGKEGTLNLLYQKNFTSSACAKMYKTELFSDVRFPKGKLHEDVAVMYLLFMNSKRISKGEEVLYFYYQRKGSIVNSEFNSRRMDYLTHTKQIIEKMKKIDVALWKAAVSRHISACFQILFSMPNNKVKEKYGLFIWKEVKQYRKIVIKDRKARKINRGACILSYLGIQFVYFVGKIKY